MADEERKRQTVLTEDRLEMAHLRKGNLQPSGEALEKEAGKESKVKVVHLKKEESEDRFDRRNLESSVICSRSDPKSITAFANLKKICEEHLAGKYRIEVIDLLKNPQLAKGTRLLPYRRW